MFNYKSGLLAVLLYLNVVTVEEYSGRRLHEWEISSDYQRQQEAPDSGTDKGDGETPSGGEDGVEGDS